ncbi:replication initiation protein [Erwinia tasmaniensis]|uniref:Initiator of plasmid replication n=1 Tax=Erwinia tasmaniensis (strain DSM 17950 / CFBP 7177 / CIP 109463 / NCPPB 4357 / Et1/99) TaxID=465817 RepID=B2VAZ5_ERWT9|nr:replication initiation protein [Erwinia tasmaniensis]CAO94843.1 Initiator of plasmid replication [Erwinia tasmaniensis Et1/99]
MKLANVTPKTKIRHRNEINHTFSVLPLPARRILFMAIAQIDSKRLIEQGQVFRITANEYAMIADIDISVAYKQMKDGANELQHSVISIPKSQLLEPLYRPGQFHFPVKVKKNTPDSIRSMNLTEYCDYVESEGYIDISFTRVIEPYICRLADGFTTQVLLSAARLTETNASSLYQLIRKNISSGKVSYFDIGVDELKDELNLYRIDEGEKIYIHAQFKDFNRDFLKKNVDTINRVTEIKDLSFDIVERVARKATRLRFSYSVERDIESEGDTDGKPEIMKGKGKKSEC